MEESELIIGTSVAPFKHLRLSPLIFSGRDSITVGRLIARIENDMIQVTFCLQNWEYFNDIMLILSIRYDNKSKYRVP